MSEECLTCAMLSLIWQLAISTCNIRVLRVNESTTCSRSPSVAFPQSGLAVCTYRACDAHTTHSIRFSLLPKQGAGYLYSLASVHSEYFPQCTGRATVSIDSSYFEYSNLYNYSLALRYCLTLLPRTAPSISSTLLTESSIFCSVYSIFLRYLVYWVFGVMCRQRTFVLYILRT